MIQQSERRSGRRVRGIAMLQPWLARRALEALLALACLATMSWQLTLVPTAYTDSWAPMSVASEVLARPGGANLYETVFFGMGIKFQYPPSALLYFDGLHAIGLGTMRRLNAVNWLLLVANAALVGMLAVRMLIGEELAGYRRVVFLGASLCALTYGPIAVGFEVGQIQILINLMFTLATLALLSGRGGVAGALMGAATAIKPQFGILLLQAALRRRTPFVVGFCAAGGALGLLSIALYGWANHLDYVQVLRHLSERGEAYVWNNSINGILNRLIGNGSPVDVVPVNGVSQSLLPRYSPLVYWPTLATTTMLLLLPMCLPFAVARNAPDRTAELLIFSIGATCSVMASPIAWIHHYGILLPVYLIALRVAFDHRSSTHGRLRFALLAVSFCLTFVRNGPSPSATGLLSLLNAPAFFGACILLGVLTEQLLAWRPTGSADSNSAGEPQRPAAMTLNP